MGTWDNAPYGNDAAADWFAGFMKTTELREHWRRELDALDVEEHPDVARAAVWFFIQLGRVYVWPIENYRDDLELARSVANQLRTNRELCESEEIARSLEAEYEELMGR